MSLDSFKDKLWKIFSSLFVKAILGIVCNLGWTVQNDQK